MSSSADQILERIEQGVVEHGGDLGGWTQRSEGALQLFDGRVTLRAQIDEAPRSAPSTIHVHLFATLHEYNDEVLEACVLGAGADANAAIAEAAMKWILLVAGPIKSFIDGKPLCLTCQSGIPAGDPAQGYVEGDYGLRGMHAYVGPSAALGFSDKWVRWDADDSKPWFRFAAESAAPRRVHLAKSTVSWRPGQGWRRELEIDGHDVSHHDPDWPAQPAGDKFGYLTRYAVFDFAEDSSEVRRRTELERTIRYFAENYSKFESLDRLEEEMIRRGYDAALVHDVETISMLAFGRVFFEPFGVSYSPFAIRARRDGKVETDVPLMSIPAYSRGRALAARLQGRMPADEFQALCFYSAESNAILKAVEATGKIEDATDMKMFPCVIPDHGVSDQTMNAALKLLQDLVSHGATAKKKKPWWKFW